MMIKRTRHMRHEKLYFPIALIFPFEIHKATKWQLIESSNLSHIKVTQINLKN